jgi:hypothetical protein
MKEELRTRITIFETPGWFLRKLTTEDADFKKMGKEHYLFLQRTRDASFRELSN